MQDLTDEDRKAVLGEVMMDELKIIREYLEDLMPIKQDVAMLKQDMAEVKADIKIVKAAVTDQGKQLHDHEMRIVSLETAR